jgi:CyaY protein
MTESEFNDLVDETFALIEDAVDDCEADIDSEDSGGVLTLSCEDGSAIIFSRQAASRELWLAARSGGFHFIVQEGRWYCPKHQQGLALMFAKITGEQAGEAITVDV